MEYCTLFDLSMFILCKIRPFFTKDIVLSAELFVEYIYCFRNLWDTRGCHIVQELTNSTFTICRCDHLTNFAILMNPWKTVSKMHFQKMQSFLDL